MEFVPAAVRRQVEQDEAALRQWNEQRQGAAAPETQVAEPAAADTPIPETEPAAPAEPAAPPAPAPESQAPRIDWKQKFLVLQGKYNAEVPRYAHELREAKASLAERDARILTLTEECTRLRVGHPNPQAEPEFDPALTNLIGKATSDAVRAATKPLEERLAVNEQDAAVRRLETFKVDVNDYVRDATGSDWTTIEQHPDFQAYMHSVEPAVGEPRGVLLNQAMQRGDAVRVAHFYTDFFSRTRPSPAPATVPAPAPAPPKPAVDPRAHLVTPATTSVSTPSPHAPKPVYTQRDLSKHYSDYGKAQLPGADPYERARLEKQDQDINAAIAEGRIRA